MFVWYEHAKDGLVWPKNNIENILPNVHHGIIQVVENLLLE